MKAYEERYIAHRGLFNNKDIPENSLIAFKKAVENDYGVELDLQLTTDHKLVVFHDTSLLRMTGIDKNLTDCSYEELLEYNLLDTTHKIPLFSEVLAVMKKETPMVVEIKADGDFIEATRVAVKMLKEAGVTFNIESFDPSVLKYLKDNNPEIIRGQLSMRYFGHKSTEKMPFINKFVLTQLITNIYTRPDYIAYDIRAKDVLAFRIISKIFKGECFAWTVRNQKQLDECREYYQGFIFDSFIPEEK